MSGGVLSCHLFGYQDVGIGNANCSHWGPDPTRSPNISGFALCTVEYRFKTFDAILFHVYCLSIFRVRTVFCSTDCFLLKISSICILSAEPESMVKSM